MPSWRRLLRHLDRRACSLARPRAGRSMLARIAMMAITTSSSIRVKARRRGRSVRPACRGLRVVPAGYGTANEERMQAGTGGIIPRLWVANMNTERQIGDHLQTSMETGQVQKSFPAPLLEWQLEFFGSFTHWCSQDRSRAGTSFGPNQDHRSI